LAQNVTKSNGQTTFVVRMPGGKRKITQQERDLRAYLTDLFKPIWQVSI